MPKIGKEYPGCRYWGYEPALADDARKPVAYNSPESAAREKARADLKALREQVKTAGYKASDLGLSKDKAISQANALESRFPGIVWNVFSHDYL